MASVEIDSLFDTNRLSDGLSILPIIVYFPLGLALAFVRLFILLHAVIVSCLLPQTSTLRCLALRVMLAITGIVVTTEGEDRCDARAKILVANHVTTLDHFVTGFALPHVWPVEWTLSPLLQWVFNLKSFPMDASREELLNSIKKFCQDSSLPLLFFPEKSTTNGRHSLLKFSDLPFKLNCYIQPVGIQVYRVSLFPIRVTTLSSSWWSDLFWCLFVPFTIFKLKLLPVTSKKDREEESLFCERVRSNLARSLNLQLSEFTYSDVEERKKEIFISSSSSSSSATSVATPTGSGAAEEIQKREDTPLTSDPELLRMVQQVRGVLSHVPSSAILSDLEKTGDVDVTITNILEGRVVFAEEASDSSKPKPTSDPAPQLTFKAATFSKSSKERHLSLEERKQNMIAAARKKYLEKHGLA